MPITIRWDDDDPNVLWQVFEGQWTVEDYIQSVDEITQAIKAHPETIDLIGDMTRSGSPPAKLLSVAGHLDRTTPDNRGTVVIVGSGLFIKTLLRVVENLTPRFSKNLYTADTVDEAHAMIAKAREPDMPAD